MILASRKPWLKLRAARRSSLPQHCDPWCHNVLGCLWSRGRAHTKGRCTSSFSSPYSQPDKKAHRKHTVSSLPYGVFVRLPTAKEIKTQATPASKSPFLKETHKRQGTAQQAEWQALDLSKVKMVFKKTLPSVAADLDHIKFLRLCTRQRGSWELQLVS